MSLGSVGIKSLGNLRKERRSAQPLDPLASPLVILLAEPSAPPRVHSLAPASCIDTFVREQIPSSHAREGARAEADAQSSVQPPLPLRSNSPSSPLRPRSLEANEEEEPDDQSSEWSKTLRDEVPDEGNNSDDPELGDDLDIVTLVKTLCITCPNCMTPYMQTLAVHCLFPRKT